MIDLVRLNRYIKGILDCDDMAAAKHVGMALAEFSMGRDFHLLHEGGVHVLKPGDFLLREGVGA